MFLVNYEGRVVDLPARMEEWGLAQAREVLSISRELMECIPSGVTMTDIDTRRLRDEIMRRFPNVVSDDEYLARNPIKSAEVVEQEPITIEEIRKVQDLNRVPEKVVDTEKVVTLDMTKEKIVGIAKEKGVKLTNTEKRFAKNKLIGLVNERYAR